MHELTDGGSAQYKSRNCMDDVSRIHGVIRLLENFHWDDGEVRFVLDQHADLDLYSAIH